MTVACEINKNIRSGASGPEIYGMAFHIKCTTVEQVISHVASVRDF